MPKLPLAEAAKRFGLSVNGMRSRAKADPVRYGLTRDNAGRLWLDFEPSAVPPAKVSTEGGGLDSLASSEAFANLLRAQVEAAERARDQAEADRDHWRAVALELVAKRRRWWPW
jgi:hypothetical protein